MALVDVIMPQLGESIAEGTIAKWHKKSGETIGRDEPLLEITTDKVDSEISAPVAGVVSELLFPEQTTVAVMTVIARIDTEPGARNETVESPAAKPGIVSSEHGRTAATAQVQEAFSETGAAPAPASEPPTEARPTAEHAGSDLGHEGRFYSPLVLNIARREQIPLSELERIEGTGMSGRVSKNDILAYLERRKHAMPAVAKAENVNAPVAEHRAPSEPLRPAQSSPVVGAREERIAMDTMRRSIADHMVRSKQTSPHVYSVSEADVSQLVGYRERMKDGFERREGVKLTLTPFFLDAVVKALKEYPLLNSSVEGETIVMKKDIHLGVAVALDQGLIVPVIKHADEKNIAGLARALADLSARARSKKLLPEDVHGGTFTVTNPGMVGNLYGIPIINQPQAAILGIGVVKKRPIVVDDAIAIRSMVYLSLSYDHRIIDGVTGGRFLERIVELLERFNTQQAV